MQIYGFLSDSAISRTIGGAFCLGLDFFLPPQDMILNSLNKHFTIPYHFTGCTLIYSCFIKRQNSMVFYHRLCKQLSSTRISWHSYLSIFFLQLDSSHIHILARKWLAFDIHLVGYRYLYFFVISILF